MPGSMSALLLPLPPLSLSFSNCAPLEKKIESSMDALEYERWHEVHLQVWLFSSFGVAWYVVASAAWIAWLTFLPLSLTMCAISCVDTCVGILKFVTKGVSRVWLKSGVCER